MRRWLTVMLSLALAGVVSRGALAAEPAQSQVSADLDGVSIPVVEIADHYCHDHDFPVIHCYATADGLSAALRRGDVKAGSAATVMSTDYVIVYSGQSYSGAYMYISQDYDTLVIVAWNDRIRSYRSLNGSSGVFWTDWYRSGFGLSFCCGSAATWLSTTFDRQITSVYRT